MIEQTITLIIQKTNYPVIHDITMLMAQANINIEDIDAQSFDSKGVIYLTVLDKFHALAVDILRGENYKVLANNHNLYEIPDEPGALAKLTQTLKDQNFSIQSLRFVKKSEGKALVSVSFDT